MIAGPAQNAEGAQRPGTPAVVVVLPTYNEAGAVVDVLRRLMKVQCAPDVLVVDDSSPDGTGDVVRRFAAQDGAGRVDLLSRPAKEGLGPAYRDGLSRVLAAGRYQVVVQGDADGSHPFERIPAMLDAVAEGADLVVGSRYCPGGSLDAEWPLGRRLLSRAANNYASRLLSLPVRDATSGFRAWRAPLLGRVLQAPMTQANGYGYLVQMLFAAVREGAVVREVPICFAQRKTGTSKLGTRIAVEGAIACLAMRFDATRHR
jgi:dolichol-phosphate mannosyltransferase